MRRRTKTLALGFCALLCTGGLLWAASPLKPIMRGWKSDVGELDRLMASRASLSEPGAQRVFARIALDAQALSDRFKGGSAEARDLRTRFDAFAKQSSFLAGHSGRDTLEAGYATWRGACKSCHDVYAN